MSVTKYFHGQIRIEFNPQKKHYPKVRVKQQK